MIDPMARVDESVVIGKGTVIRQFASVTGTTVLGRDCSVSPFAMLHGPKFGDRCRISGGVMMGPGFLIGDDVFIGPNVTFCNDAWPRAHKNGFDVELFDGSLWAVIVESGASIGAGAVVLPGVKIGAGAMIAAGAVVTRDVPSFHLFGQNGAPPRQTGERNRMRTIRC